MIVADSREQCGLRVRPVRNVPVSHSPTPTRSSPAGSHALPLVFHCTQGRLVHVQDYVGTTVQDNLDRVPGPLQIDQCL